MRKERIQLILLCEDKQQKSFVYRFLKEKGINTNILRVNASPKGKGSGEKYVKDQFTKELNYYRSRITSAKLIVMIDGDLYGVKTRINQLELECKRRGVEFRKKNEAVMIAVPTWNIETWIHFLNGNDIDENKKDYPKLIKKEKRCQPAVDRLVEKCNNKESFVGCPSLTDACEEYNKIFK